MTTVDIGKLKFVIRLRPIGQEKVIQMRFGN